MTSAAHTTAIGDGLTHYSPNETAQFVITAKDSQGQPRDSGGDAFVVESKDVELKATVVDQKNGTYAVSYAVGDSKQVAKANE